MQALRPVQGPLADVVLNMARYICCILFLSFLKAAESESSAEIISEKMEEIKAAESVEDLTEEMPGTKQDHDSNISKQKELDVQNQEISLLKVCVF